MSSLVIAENQSLAFIVVLSSNHYMNNNKSGKSRSGGKVLFFLFHELMRSITRALLIVMLLRARAGIKKLSVILESLKP